MHSIILIGPYGIGKTTVGRLVAKKLGLSHYSLDEERPWKYYREMGLTDEYAGQLGACTTHQLTACRKKRLAHMRCSAPVFEDAVEEQMPVVDAGGGWLRIVS